MMTKFFASILKLCQSENALDITNMSAKCVKQPVKCRHILDLSLEEKRDFLKSFDIVLSDCDGVIWTLSGIIPRAGEAINVFHKIGKEVKYITNNGMRTDQDCCDKIQKCGVQNATKDDIVIPVKVIGNYLKKYHPQDICYCIGCDIFMDSLSEMGITVKNVSCPSSFQLHDFSKIVRSPSDAKIAVLDVNLYQNFADYALAHQFLIKSDCKLFISAGDTLMRLSEDITTVGPGIFVDALIDASTNEPIMFGKPSKLMAQYMIESYQIADSKRALFIGDNLSIDITFAINHEFQSLFVLSGANTKEDMLALPYNEQPDYYADSVADFWNFLRAWKYDELKFNFFY